MVILIHDLCYHLTRKTSTWLGKKRITTVYKLRTYDYFESQSRNHPNWWHNKVWWKPFTDNPIYTHKYPKQ
jgi:hypothetical protein